MFALDCIIPVCERVEFNLIYLQGGSATGAVFIAKTKKNLYLKIIKKDYQEIIIASYVCSNSISLRWLPRESHSESFNP